MLFFIILLHKFWKLKQLFIFTFKRLKMKKILLVSLIMLLTVATFAQKKEKLKGSKIVKIEVKKVPTFETIDITDNLDIYLIKGTNPSIEIDADDNLHSIIDISTKGKMLYLSTIKTVTSAKKFSLRITYTNDLKQIILHNNAKVNSLIDLDLETITFKLYDDSQLFATSKSKSFSLFLDDEARAEINLKGEKTTLNLSKNSSLKALIVSNEMVLDMYQKGNAKIEGDCNNLKVRLDNSARFIGKNMVSKATDLTTELESKVSIFAKNAIKISASGNSNIELYGEPKIDLAKFTDTASLKKIKEN